MIETNQPLQINPAVATGLGNFGGAVLQELAARLQRIHPVLAEGMGWLWLNTAGWQVPRDSAPGSPLFGMTIDAAGESAPPKVVAREPWYRACEHATSGATAGALEAAGYKVGACLDAFVIARIDDALSQGALWSLLDLIRDQPGHPEVRVTLVLASDSRRFDGTSAPVLGWFFNTLAQRLVDDGIAWCYLCDVLDSAEQIVEGERIEELATSQVQLVSGFLSLWIGSDLRSQEAYARTALPALVEGHGFPDGVPLVSLFGFGSYVLPVNRIVAATRDRVAVQIHEAMFPSKPSEADREAAAYAAESLLMDFDLTPDGLYDRLSRGEDGAALRFDTTPPELIELEPAAALEALSRWYNDLEARWVDDDASSAVQIQRNVDAFVRDWAARLRREVDGLVDVDRYGLHRASVLLDELPQAIEDARVQVMADDRYYRKRAVPSIPQKLCDLRDLAAERRMQVWRDLGLVSLASLLALVLALWLKPGWWPVAVLLWLVGGGSVLARHYWRRRYLSGGGQQALVSAVQFKYQAGQEQQIRVARRNLFDALLNVVRQERKLLLAWKRAIRQARAALSNSSDVSFEPTFGERLLSEPAGTAPSPDGIGAEQIAAMVEQLLNEGERPAWRDGRAEAIAAWLRAGASRALGDGPERNGESLWQALRPTELVADLTKSVVYQWPLGPGEKRGVELVVVGLYQRDPGLGLSQKGRDLVSVTTRDPQRLSCVLTCHGLRLEELSALQRLTMPSTDEV